MDKLRKRLPIRQKKLNYPVVFTFNIQLAHYTAYGTAHYDPIKKIFQQNNINNVHLLPNVCNFSMTIDQRAALLAERLNEISKSQNDVPIHVVTHSFCGVDMRAAITLMGANKFVKSLTTVCSPHHGLSLLYNFQRQPERYRFDLVQKAIEIVGLAPKTVNEFIPENMKAFNEVVTDAEGVGYYSIGAQKEFLTVTPLLRHGHDIISLGQIQNRNDGLTKPEECKWGEYLLTYQHDHLEMVGFNPEHNPRNIYNLVGDNIRLNEILTSEEEMHEFGLSHLASNSNHGNRQHIYNI